MHRTIGFILVILAIFATAGAIWITTQPTMTAAGPTVVYLADPAAPNVDIARLQARGVYVVHTRAELEAALPGASGLIIDRTQLAGLPKDLLATQLRQGRVLATINTPVEEFRQLVNGRATDTTKFKSDWSGRAFYSLIWESPPGVDPRRGVILSDQLPNPEYLVSLVQDQVRQQGLGT